MSRRARSMGPLLGPLPAYGRVYAMYMYDRGAVFESVDNTYMSPSMREGVALVSEFVDSETSSCDVARLFRRRGNTESSAPVLGLLKRVFFRHLRAPCCRCTSCVRLLM